MKTDTIIDKTSAMEALLSANTFAELERIQDAIDDSIVDKFSHDDFAAVTDHTRNLICSTHTDDVEWMESMHIHQYSPLPSMFFGDLKIDGYTYEVPVRISLDLDENGQEIWKCIVATELGVKHGNSAKAKDAFAIALASVAK